MNTNMCIIAKYCPSIPRAEVIQKSKYRYKMDDLSTLGSGFAIVANELSNTAKSAPSDKEVLYRCVFQKGVTGHLAEFKDGSGYTGTIVNETGLTGQARWIPVEGTEQVLQFNPTTLIIAIALMNINQKLDQIVATQEEILKFLHEEKSRFLRELSICCQIRWNNIDIIRLRSYGRAAS